MEQRPVLVSDTNARYIEQKNERRDSWKGNRVWGEQALREYAEVQGKLRDMRQQLSELVHRKARTASLSVLPFGLGKLIERERERQTTGSEKGLHQRIYDAELSKSVML